MIKGKDDYHMVAKVLGTFYGIYKGLDNYDQVKITFTEEDHFFVEGFDVLAHRLGAKSWSERAWGDDMIYNIKPSNEACIDEDILEGDNVSLTLSYYESYYNGKKFASLRVEEMVKSRHQE